MSSSLESLRGDLPRRVLDIESGEAYEYEEVATIPLKSHIPFDRIRTMIEQVGNFKSPRIVVEFQYKVLFLADTTKVRKVVFLKESIEGIERIYNIISRFRFYRHFEVIKVYVAEKAWIDNFKLPRLTDPADVIAL